MKKLFAVFITIVLLVSILFGNSFGNVYAKSINFNGDWVLINDNSLVHDITNINVLPNGSILCVSNGKIIKSINQGSSFASSNTGIKGSVESIATDGKKIYAITFSSVYSSIDTGTTWYLVTTISSGTITYNGIFNGALYLGTSIGKVMRIGEDGKLKTIADNLPTIKCVFITDSYFYVGTTKGLFYLKNNSFIENTAFEGSSVVSMANLNKYVFVLEQKSIVHGDEHYIDTILKKTKDGLNFIEVKKFENTVIDNIVTSGVAVYLVSSNNGILKSTNFVKWESPDGFSSISNVYAFTVNPYNTDEIFVATDDSLIRSRDGGSTIEVLKKYIDGLSFSDVFIYNGDFLVGTNNGVFQRLESGKYEQMGMIGINVKTFAEFNSDLYAGTNKGLFVFSDGKWRNAGITVPINALAKNDTYLFVASEDGVYTLSANSVVKKIDEPGFDEGVYSLYVSEDRIIVGTAFNSNGGLFMSEDNSKTWKRIPNTPGTDITAVYSTNNGIFIGTWVMGIYYTDDNGINWTTRNNGLNDLNITGIKFDNGVIYCTTTKGVYFSLDSGKVWNSFGEKLNSSRVLSLTVSENYIFAASWDGLFKWQNNFLSAHNEENKIILQWSNFPEGVNITGFELYKKTGTNGEYILLKKFNNNVYNYIDKDIKNGEEYCYFVKSFDNETPPNYFISSEMKTVADSIPPKIVVSAPLSNSKVDSDTITVSGFVTDEGSGINSVTINGREAELEDDNSFSVAVSLEKGNNTITIVAEDKAGNKTAKTVVVDYGQKILITLQPDNPMMTVNGTSQEIDPGRGTKPVIIAKWSRTVVPIRAIVEALGGTIGWEGTEKKVTINFKDTVIELWINKPQAKVNGVTKWIDSANHNVKPIIVNSRTMLPLRFVAENLGCTVGWDAATKTITIIYSG